MNYFIANLIFILQTLISVYIYVLLLRFILQKRSANYYNQIIQVLVKITDPVVKPTRIIFPFIKGYDLASLFLAVALQVANIFLAVLVSPLGALTGLGFFLSLIGNLGQRVVYLYMAAIIIQAVCSWIPNLARNPVNELVYLLCEPIMRRVHRIVPAVAGIDFSPVVVLIVLYIINSFVFYPLVYAGVGA